MSIVIYSSWEKFDFVPHFQNFVICGTTYILSKAFEKNSHTDRKKEIARKYFINYDKDLSRS